ncbi:MAG TPA: hypothetical protein VFN61_02980 [Acidimicrobiales bacterium]|nr:hypothetical protein [Acidimicrobiales bacterium]
MPNGLHEPLVALAHAVGAALSELASSPRDGVAVARTGYLRKVHTDLAGSASASLEGEDAGPVAALVVYTDGLVDAIGTLSSLLRAKFGEGD